MTHKLVLQPNGEYEWVDASQVHNNAPARPYEPDVVSDSLGCTKWEVESRREEAKRLGFKVEWVEDKGASATEGYYSCKATPTEFARYERARYDGEEAERSGGSNAICANDIEDARKRILQQYPIKDGK
jgi:hypothetical protein